MKCVKDSKGKITRVTDTIADDRVTKGDYTYCGKSEWKKVQGPKSATKPHSV
jgi:hypothetical protein